MSIFIFSDTRVIVQGITGGEGKFWTKHMINAGTKVVAGITPGKEGETVEGVPVFHTIRRALSEVQADASVIFVPASFAKDAVFEALDAGLKKVVVLADGIPTQDSLEIRSWALSLGAMVMGGNTSGVATIGESMMGFIPFWLTHVYGKGNVGIMTRSGSLTNEVASHVVRAGYGFTSVIGIGGDPVPCTRFAEVMPLFQEDVHTKALVIVGELGGTMEEEAAELVQKKIFTKPLVAFIAGRTAPPEKKMGHAGAIITAGKGTVSSKVEALEKAGARVASRPSQVGQLLKESLRGNGDG